MPTYEYKCNDCDHVTLRTSKIADRDEPCPCEECEGETLKGFWTGGTPVVKRKGTGWTPQTLSPMGRRRKQSPKQSK